MRKHESLIFTGNALTNRPPHAVETLVTLPERNMGFPFQCGWIYGNETVIDGLRAYEDGRLYAFSGGNAEDMYTLGGVLELQLGSKIFEVKRSCMIYVPAGLLHGNFRIHSLQRPVFWYTGALSAAISTAERRQWTGNLESLIVTELRFNDNFHVDWQKRFLYMNRNIVPGACYSSLCWYLGAADCDHPARAHAHPSDEVLCFFGSDPDTPDELYGEIELEIDGERFCFNKSTVVFLPNGLPHCPMRIRRVDRPILHMGLIPGMELHSKQ